MIGTCIPFQEEKTQMETQKIKQMLNKVPAITVYFWIIKVLCTTIGETAADYLNESLHFGLSGTSIVMGALLLVVMFFQFRTKKYLPSIYWLAVVLVSVVGTLITDLLTDKLGIPLETTTIVFAVALLLTFIIWFMFEKTLSVHSIITSRREAFYWLAILFTFALGTAAGDLSAEKFKLGYLNSIYIFGGLIAVVTIVYYVFSKIRATENKRQPAYAILAFWLAYILTRPLGASIGDFLSQDKDAGGLALGATMTSGIFFVAILSLVIFLSLTKSDELPPEA
jgi:uncharacterized membrane-anchored protein